MHSYYSDTYILKYVLQFMLLHLLKSINYYHSVALDLFVTFGISFENI